MSPTENDADIWRAIDDHRKEANAMRDRITRVETLQESDRATLNRIEKSFAVIEGKLDALTLTMAGARGGFTATRWAFAAMMAALSAAGGWAGALIQGKP